MLEGNSGVLEWCVSREDAECQVARMRAHGGFEALRAEPWVELDDWDRYLSYGRQVSPRIQLLMGAE